MAIYTGQTDDNTINGHLSSIRTAEYGIEARAPMAAAIQRCYETAKVKAGATFVPQSSVTAQTNRVRNEVYGDNVRDAFRNGIMLCYQARGSSLSNTETNLLNSLIYAQTGEDLKNNILKSIVQCYRDVS